MATVLALGLIAIQFIALALFVVALPVFVGLMAWDVFSDRRRAAATADIAQLEPRRSSAVRATPRLTA
jgi:hypothetical protein